MKESIIKPGQFYFLNSSTNQVALNLEELRLVSQVGVGEKDSNSSAWEKLGVPNIDGPETRKKNEGRISKLLGNRQTSAWDTRK
jgi:hypothetical protein